MIFLFLNGSLTHSLTHSSTHHQVSPNSSMMMGLWMSRASFTSRWSCTYRTIQLM